MRGGQVSRACCPVRRAVPGVPWMPFLDRRRDLWTCLSRLVARGCLALAHGPPSGGSSPPAGGGPYHLLYAAGQGCASTCCDRRHSGVGCAGGARRNTFPDNFRTDLARPTEAGEGALPFAARCSTLASRSWFLPREIWGRTNRPRRLGGAERDGLGSTPPGAESSATTPATPPGGGRPHVGAAATGSFVHRLPLTPRPPQPHRRRSPAAWRRWTLSLPATSWWRLVRRTSRARCPAPPPAGHLRARPPRRPAPPRGHCRHRAARRRRCRRGPELVGTRPAGRRGRRRHRGVHAPADAAAARGGARRHGPRRRRHLAACGGAGRRACGLPSRRRALADRPPRRCR